MSTLLFFIAIFPIFTALKDDLYVESVVGINLSSYLVDTASVTPTVTMFYTQTQLPTSTATLLPGTTVLVSPTTTGTALATSQNTQRTPIPSGTVSRTPGLTMTNTPNITNTPGPTETFRPLPSITLLFPIETATPTEDESLIERSSDQNNLENSGKSQSNNISARSVLLIGTVLLLWIILAIFLVFFFRKVGE